MDQRRLKFEPLLNCLRLPHIDYDELKSWPTLRIVEWGRAQGVSYSRSGLSHRSHPLLIFNYTVFMCWYLSPTTETIIPYKHTILHSKNVIRYKKHELEPKLGLPFPDRSSVININDLATLSVLKFVAASGGCDPDLVAVLTEEDVNSLRKKNDLIIQPKTRIRARRYEYLKTLKHTEIKTIAHLLGFQYINILELSELPPHPKEYLISLLEEVAGVVLPMSYTSDSSDDYIAENIKDYEMMLGRDDDFIVPSLESLLSG